VCAYEERRPPSRAGTNNNHSNKIHNIITTGTAAAARSYRRTRTPASFHTRMMRLFPSTPRGAKIIKTFFFFFLNFFSLSFPLSLFLTRRVVVIACTDIIIHRRSQKTRLAMSSVWRYNFRRLYRTYNGAQSNNTTDEDCTRWRRIAENVLFFSHAEEFGDIAHVILLLGMR